MRRGVPGCAVLLALGALACSEDEPTSPDLEYADPRYWSGGALTVFSPAAQAYSTPAPNVSNLALHLEGDRLVEVGRIAGHDVPFGGLGPTFNSISCAQCHFSDGRSMPDSWRLGGSGAGSTNFLIRISTPEGSPVPGYGTVIQDQATFGAVPEAKVSVTMRSARNGQFADGEPFELVVPRVTFGDWYSGTAPKPFAFSLRIPARQVGLGLLRAIPDETLEALAAEQVPPISGRPNRVAHPRGGTRIGRFGYKAQNADLDIERTFLSDIGITGELFPEEPFAEQNPAVPDSVLHHPPDMRQEEFDAVDFYFHTLGVPARRDVRNPEVLRGEALFGEIGCASCHTPVLRTTSAMVRTLLGTEVPELSNQEIHPYTDLLLHDLGAELADPYRQGIAEGAEWRTTPLWGIGLQSVINGHSYFLHDGRARSLQEAILWHGGESEVVTQRFIDLPGGDRRALLRFLESL